MAITGRGRGTRAAGPPTPPWRRRRTLRLALAGALLVAAPLAGAAGRDGTDVVTAAHDLPAGHVLTGDDLATATLPPGAEPDGALTTPPTGSRLASAVRRGETLTDARVASGAHDTDGRVVAVPLADPALASVLVAGDVVDLVAAADTGPLSSPAPAQLPVPAGPPGSPGSSASQPESRPPTVVAAGATVVEVPPVGRTGSATVLVSVPADRAAALASAAAATALGVLVHR